MNNMYLIREKGMETIVPQPLKIKIINKVYIILKIIIYSNNNLI
jgi:hypothetical protein